VNVSTESQLQAAVQGAKPGTTILIAPGTYNLTNTLYLNGKSDVVIRGATNNRDDVVLVGKGMNAANDGGVPYGIWINGQRVTIANLTIRDVYNHPIILNPPASSPHIYNVRLVNAGQQFVKSNPDGSGGGVAGGIVEYSLLEYTGTARDYYTNGVDVHTAANWIVRNNLFRNIVAPAGQLAGPAVLMWNSTSNAIVEGNTFINCQREISLGLIERTPNDNSGGIIRNNFIYRKPGMDADVAIYVGDSPSTQVLHNTILVNGSYPTPIEYRYANSSGVIVKNNLLDGQIWARDGATGTVSGNYMSADTTLFVNASAGDLHLVSGATAVIDRVAAVAGAATDWDGTARPQGTAADYGADEFGAAAPSSNQAPSVALTSPAAGASFTAPASVVLAATAVDSDGSVVGVDFYVNSTLVGSDTSGPYSFTWANVPAGTYDVTAVARDDDGASATSARNRVTVSVGGSTTALPAPWSTRDIGSPVAGSAGYASGTFTIQGGGVDIWGTSDQFRFVYQQMTGDGEIVARVASLTKADPWSKAGVMIRSGLTAAATHAFVVVSAGNGVTFQRRTTAGGQSVSNPGPAVAAPVWVKLVRVGSVFTGYTSADGTKWTSVGSSTISMGSAVYVGLPVTSHTTSAIATATVSNVTVKP
jgi:hypothetical protein